MPRFRYEVKKGPGRPVTGVLEAESQRAAVIRLRDMGYLPITIEEYRGAEKKDVLKHALRRVRLKDRNVFFRQLANLLEAGMPISRALSTLIEQTENPKMVRIIERVRDDIQKGSTFAEALERHSKTFPAVHTNLVRAGESGGMLENVLWRVVTFGEQEEDLRGKALSAMAYPVFLLVMGSIAVFILISFVFPKFIVIFEDFQVNLPWPTRVLMAFCGFMGSYWWAVLLGVAALVTLGVSYRRSPHGRRQIDKLMLRIPVVNGVVQRFEMAKFARTLGTLMDNGVPVLTSLKITLDTLGNAVIADEVAMVHDRVAEGDSISDSLQHTKTFPPLVVNMVAVGEEGGRLGTVIQRISEAYDTEVERAVKTLTSLLEPVLIVVMGIVIGFMVIAMLLPLLTLSANVA